MRVGLFVDHFDPSKGGMETALAALVDRLVRGGHDALVYCLTAADGAPGRQRVLNVAAAPRGELERSFAAASLAAAQADGCDVTVAVRHCPEVDVYWPHGGAHAATLAAGEAAKGGVVGAVSRVLHRASPRHRVFVELESAALSGGARRVWCVSELVRSELAAAYPGSVERLELHTNGVDRSAFHPGLRDEWRAALRNELAVPPNSPVLLFMGANLRLKGWAILGEAMSRVTDLRWTCVVAGADVERVTGSSRAAGVGDRVIAIPHRDAAQLLGVTDLLVQPTFRDPCSLATLEALASGVPVLTTTANGAADALTDTAAGQAVSAGDADAFATALRAWIATISDDALRLQAADAARACTDTRDVDGWLSGMVASLEDLAARPEATP